MRYIDRAFKPSHRNASRPILELRWGRTSKSGDCESRNVLSPARAKLVRAQASSCELPTPGARTYPPPRRDRLAGRERVATIPKLVGVTEPSHATMPTQISRSQASASTWAAWDRRMRKFYGLAWHTMAEGENCVTARRSDGSAGCPRPRATGAASWERPPSYNCSPTLNFRRSDCRCSRTD